MAIYKIILKLIIILLSSFYYVNCDIVVRYDSTIWNESLERFYLLTRQPINDHDRIKCRESKVMITPLSIEEIVFIDANEIKQKRLFLTKCITYYSEISRDLYFRYTRLKLHVNKYVLITGLSEVYRLKRVYLESIKVLGLFLISLDILLHKIYEYGFVQKRLKYPPELECEVGSSIKNISIEKPYIYSKYKEFLRDSGVQEILICKSNEPHIIPRAKRCIMARRVITDAIQKANENFIKFLNKYKRSYSRKHLNKALKWRKEKGKLYLLNGIVEVALAMIFSDMSFNKQRMT